MQMNAFSKESSWYQFDEVHLTVSGFAIKQWKGRQYTDFRKIIVHKHKNIIVHKNSPVHNNKNQLTFL